MVRRKKTLQDTAWLDDQARRGVLFHKAFTGFIPWTVTRRRGRLARGEFGDGQAGRPPPKRRGVVAARCGQIRAINKLDIRCSGRPGRQGD